MMAWYTRLFLSICNFEYCSVIVYSFKFQLTGVLYIRLVQVLSVTLR